MLKSLKISGFSPMRSGAGGAAVKVINTILQKQTRKTNNPTNNTLTDSRRLYAKYTPSQYNHTRSNYNNGEYNTAKCCDKSYNTNIQSDGADAAMAEFNQMTVFFSGCRDWPDIYKEVMAFLLEMKQQTDHAEAERVAKSEASLLRALAANGLNGQTNILFGQSAQAPYYGASTNEGDKH